MNRLAYIEVKIASAQVHLDALKREIGIYLQDAYTVNRKDDIDNARHICRTEQNAIPPIIGMLLGEFLYCLRSGLDQAAWQLALPTAKRDFPRDIYFPIVEERSKRLNTVWVISLVLLPRKSNCFSLITDLVRRRIILFGN